MPARTPPPSESGPVNEMLHVLHAFNHTLGFESWTSVRGAERDKLSVNLTREVTLSADFILSLFRAFPVKLRGPFLCQKALSFEFLAEADLSAPVLATSRKRKHRELEPDAPDSTSLDALAARLHPVIAEAVHVYNGSSISVGKGVHGTDERGPWLKFELGTPERLNLAFVPSLYTHAALAEVRDMAIVCAEPVFIFMRPFGDQERRIVHEWEVVRQFPASGSFTFFRKRVLQAGLEAAKSAAV